MGSYASSRTSTSDLWNTRVSTKRMGVPCSHQKKQITSISIHILALIPVNPA